jgi:putative hydrolase of the HAD superfamily
MQPDLLATIRRGSDWTDAFDVQVFSCDVGLVKPEPQICEHLLGRLRLQAAHVLFVDDVAGSAV